MAALLCQSVGSCCTSFGRCLSCQACGSCCSFLCEGLGRVLSSPFTPYLLTTIVLNSPPAIWGLRTAVETIRYKEDCQDSQWLFVNAILSIIHLLAAFYIVHRIQEERQAAVLEEGTPTKPIDTEAAASEYQTMERGDEKAEAATPSLFQTVATKLYPGPAKVVGLTRAAVTGTGEGGSNSVQRLKTVFCYDIGVALYILVVIFWFVWQTIGISKVFVSDNNDSFVCEAIEKRTILSILCGFLFIMLSCVALSCSFICLRYN